MQIEKPFTSLELSRSIRKLIRDQYETEWALRLIKGMNGECWVTSKGNTLAHEAARFDNAKVVRALHDKKYPLSTFNNDGVFPLHWAIYYDSLEAAAALIECGHPVDCRTKRGQTPLHVAVRARNVKAVKLLLSHDANPMMRIDEVVDCFMLIDSLTQDAILSEIKALLSDHQNDALFSQIFS